MKNNMKKMAAAIFSAQLLSGCLVQGPAPVSKSFSNKRALYQYDIPQMLANQNQTVLPRITNCIDNITGNQIGKEFCADLAIPKKFLCAGKTALQDKDCDPTALKNEMLQKEAAYEASSAISWDTFNSDQALYQGKVVQLYESDFASGTLRIKVPCKLKLMEDVQFNPNRGSRLADGTLDPNRVHDWYPEATQTEYQSSSAIRQAYQLGFFASMTLEADGIIVDLNGKSLSMHPEFRLMQQFFAHIELSDRPFAPNNGPVNFGNTLKSAHKVWIKNGTLGYSSHQGIHGNDASDVLISNVDIKDFTVAGISLNGSKNVQVLDTTIKSLAPDLQPIYGGWSELRFSIKLIEGLRDFYASQGIDIFSTDASNPFSSMASKLQTAFNNAKTVQSVVFNSVVNGEAPSATGTKNPMTALSAADRAVMRNRIRITDANAYGIVINPSGNATGPFLENLIAKLLGGVTSPAQPSNIFIARTSINGVDANPREMMTLSSNIGAGSLTSSTGNQRGPTGSIFNYKDTLNLTTTSVDYGSYTGNVLSNIQIELAALQDLLPAPAKPMLGQISIDPVLVTMKRDNDVGLKRVRILPMGTAIPAQASIGNKFWVPVDSSAVTAEFPKGTPVDRDGATVKFASLGNGDIQHHVLKGIFGLRADGVDGLTLVDVAVSGVHNYTVQGFSPIANGQNIGWTGALDGGHEGQAGMLGFFGNHSRGISVYASENVKMQGVNVSNIVSETGPVWGVDINNKSAGVKISDLAVSTLNPVGGVSGFYAKPTFVGGQISPNWAPVAITLDVDSSVSSVKLDQSVANSSIETSSIVVAPWVGL